MNEYENIEIDKDLKIFYVSLLNLLIQCEMFLVSLIKGSKNKNQILNS